MKKIALIGASGQLGTDIQKVFSQDKYFDVIPLSHNDLDITDNENVKRTLEKISPHIVINTSAYHRVDDIEDKPDKAFKVNVIAQKNLSFLCKNNNWTVVFISTDYVFGENKYRTKPYIETDTPGPINMYGISKLAGEYATSYSCPRHFIIRSCGLYGVVGSAGKGGNFVETMIRLGKEKDVVKVVNDQILSPTYTINIAENIKELLKTDKYGLYHMTSSGQCSWWEFASTIFSMLEMKVKCDPVNSNEFITKARRPAYSVLENYNLKKIGMDKMKPWRDNLRSYLIEKGHL